MMSRIKDIYAVCYISVFTGEIATVLTSNNDVVSFELNGTVPVLRSHNDYIEAKANQGELQVNIVKLFLLREKYGGKVKDTTLVHKLT